MMKAVNQKATKTLEALTKGLDNVGDHRSIENAPWTRLVIENIGTAGDGRILFSMAHYPNIELGEDPLVDPEVCFIRCIMPVIRKVKGVHQVVDEVQYYPYYIKYVTGKEFTYVRFEKEGWEYYDYRFFSQKGLAEFVGVWTKNIEHQGFIEAMNKPSKEFKGSARDFLRENMGEELYKQATNSGLLIEEGDGSLRAPIKTPLQVGTAAYNFAKAEGMF